MNVQNAFDELLETVMDDAASLDNVEDTVQKLDALICSLCAQLSVSQWWAVAELLGSSMQAHAESAKRTEAKLSKYRTVTENEVLTMETLPTIYEEILVLDHPDFNPRRPVRVVELEDLMGDINIKCWDPGKRHDCNEFGCHDACDSIGTVGEMQYHLTVQIDGGNR